MTSGEFQPRLSRRRTTKKSLLIVLGILAAFCGWFLGEIAWRITPIGWKLNTDTRYLLCLGSAEEMRNNSDFHGAESTLNSAIQLRPKRYEAYYDLGDLFLSEGRTNAAIDQYTTALLYCGTGPTNLLSHDEQLRQRVIIGEKIRDLQKARSP